jgi:hypothetical protein
MIHRHFGKLIEQGRRTGQVRRDVSAKLIVEILLGATQSVVNPAAVSELEITVAEGFSAVMKVVLDGILVRPGSRR